MLHDRLLQYRTMAQTLLAIGCALVIGVAASLGTPRQSKGTMTIRPVTKTYQLDRPIVGKSKWDENGYLIHYQTGRSERPLIWLYNSEGQFVSQISPAETLTNVRRMTLMDVAMRKDGALLIATTLRSTQNKLASALLEFDWNGTLKRVIKTDPFTPVRIAIDDENNIWILGYDWQQQDKNNNWPQVQKLSAEGHLVTSTLPRSLFPKEFDPLDVSGPGIGVSDRYFDVVGGKVYAWFPGVNQLAVLGLDGQVLHLVNEPFRALFGRHAKFLEIRSLTFLPENRMVVQAMNFGAGVLLGYGWFLSENLGRTWSSIAHNLEDPLASYLVGWTWSKEAVFLRLTSPDAGVVEICPVVFNSRRPLKTIR